GSNYVSVSDAIYLVYGDTIHMLDPATGQTTRELSMPGEDKPNWGAVVVHEDLLLATASPVHVPLKDEVKGEELPDGMQPMIGQGDDWQYMAGDHPSREWAQPDFEARGWKNSSAGFGFGDDDDETVLEDMRDRYSVVYIRKSFRVSDIGNINELGLVINYDDAFIAYLNGKEILRAGVGKGSGARASDIDSHEADGYVYFRIVDPSNLLREGVNMLAIEGHNDSVKSSDFSLDPYLIGRRDGDPGATKTSVPSSWREVSGITLNADYASGSRMLVAMDRHTGKILWKRKAEYSFRHNAIAVAGEKVFCIDGMSETKLAYFKRRGLNSDEGRTLYALDAKTGKPLWEAKEGVFGTWLSYSAERDVLLEASSRSGDRATDEPDRGMTAYRASDGKVLWRTDESYKGPPILYHDWIITQTGGGSASATDEAKVFNLLDGKTVMGKHPMTGETIPWNWIRFKGCNTAIASENLLTFRSASSAFVDLTAGHGTASIGGFKSGCTSNLIVANGVMNAPDYTRTCICSYQNQASVALIHMPEVAYWTFDYYRCPSEPKPVRQVGINLGAPGNRYMKNGTLWLEFPSVGGPSPDVPVRAEYDQPQWYRHHTWRVEGEYNWIGASGVTGLREMRVRMFIQPGENPRQVDAFDKHIGKIPTWSEDQITGAFEQPRPYTVRLYFAETQGAEAGQRLFNVSLQGQQVLEAFDIAGQAGGPNRLVVKEFKGIDIQDDLKINLTPVTVTCQPLLCGIEIVAEGW
ncbi:MAG: PQQ-binding-like beta-propeller repeat protein, partial [Sedimentisphaerales bacterium]|nr:PQQ-binding-like beta-propeller repeat protein [Sedimentisphaerales bacterium]